MTTAEKLRAKIAKLEEAAADAEYDERVRSHVPEATAARDSEVARLTAERDRLQHDDDERARLTASLAHIDATLAVAIDTHASGALELRTALLAGSGDLLALQTASTSNLLTVRGLEQSREEVAAMLDQVPTPDNDEATVADLDAAIERLASADPLDMAEMLVEKEDRAEAARASFVTAALSARLLAPTAEDERHRRAIEVAQAKHDAAVQATPYRGW
jgi:hypothetical protein